MSWYIEYLILNRDSIRSATKVEECYTSNAFDLIPEAQVSFNLDDDVYSDLLTVECEIKRLIGLGVISDLELNILNLVLDGKSYVSIEKILEMHRSTISNIFKKLCDKVSQSLGDYFTDEGFMDNMIKKYNLNDEEEIRLKKILLGDK
jgi:DNA-binding CsgD family transcriptional regulator